MRMIQYFKTYFSSCVILLAGFAMCQTAVGQAQQQKPPALLCVPVVGQGMGYNIQDLVDIEISRYGEMITVKRHGKIVFQGKDTTSTARLNSGKIAICSRPGHCGPALDEISVVNQAAPPPIWEGPTDHSDFTFFFNEGRGNLINSADGKHWGEVELGWGYKSGDWVDDGVKQGNKSWASYIGTARIYNVKYSKQFTLEGYFKIPSSHKLYVYDRTYFPIFFMQIQGNSRDIFGQAKGNKDFIGQVNIVQPEEPEGANWGNLERGGLFANVFSRDSAYLRFIFPWTSRNRIDGGAFSYDQWHRVALIRDGTRYTLYLDGEEKGSTLIPRYGEANLVKGILTMAQPAHHDLINFRSKAAYLFIDQVRLSSRVLRPDEFLKGDEPGYIPPPASDSRQQPAISDNFDDGIADGWIADSAGNWRVTDGVYHVYRGVKPSTRNAVGFLQVASIWEKCTLQGDFTIFARIGISPTAQMEDPDDSTNMNMKSDEDNNIGWFRNNYAIAFCYQDGFTSYVANFYPQWPWASGLLKYHR